MTTFRDQLRGRYAVLMLVIVFVLGSLLVRLWTMQVLSGQSFAAQAEDNRIRNVSIESPRGKVLDRNRRPLITNRPALAVTVVPTAVDDIDLLTRLSGLLKMPVAEIQEKIRSSRTEALKPRIIKLDVPFDVVAYLSEHSAEFKGVSVETVAVREYPYGGLAAHVLGYTGEISPEQLKDDDLAGYALGAIVGKAGVERQFEKVLQGEKGDRRLEVDARGRVRRVLDTREPVPGRDIVLTLDIEVQKVAEKALTDAIAAAHREKFTKASAAAAVVLDVKTGDVLAMASYPTYDPKIFLGGISHNEWKRLTDKESDYPLNNRAIMAAYPPASTFKAVTGLAGLKYGVTSAGADYDCAGKWSGMGASWSKSCWKHSGHGAIGFFRGVEESCDTVFYEIGWALYKAGGEKLQSVARSLGLGTRTGIDLPGEVRGRIPDAKWKAEINRNFPEVRAWVPGDTVNMAIGQGDVLTTPLQVATVYAGLANDGKVVEPHVLSEVLDRQGKPVLRHEPVVTHDSKLSLGQLEIMRTSLVGVTEQGTAKGAFQSFPVQVAGKTGTAQVSKKDDYAWFAAFAPADEPKYAVAVLVEQGGHGGSVAAPAAREILGKLFNTSVEFVRTTDDSR